MVDISVQQNLKVDCNHWCWLRRTQLTGNQLQHWRHELLTVLSNSVSSAAVLSEVENTFLTLIACASV